ncbi:hypothetical protein [Ensifer aridi]|uniref:hypothetical protein n=1 Tax=Ensifer aridi TaxID=1708715 RepID=UPI001F3F9DE0|nr:hypothetical protein [Ensifer aridi]
MALLKSSDAFVANDVFVGGAFVVDLGERRLEIGRIECAPHVHLLVTLLGRLPNLPDLVLAILQLEGFLSRYVKLE